MIVTPLRRVWLYLLLLLLVALGALQMRFWWGQGGWQQAQEVRVKAETQRAENARLQLRNDALAADVLDLKSGEVAVEERARSELGMIKPGETFYRVVDDPSVKKPAVVIAPETAPATKPAIEVPAEQTSEQTSEQTPLQAEPQP